MKRLKLEESPGIFRVEFDNDRNVIDEDDEEPLYEVNDKILRGWQGFSQEYNWNDSLQYCISYHEPPYLFFYIDFNINSIAKLLKMSNIAEFYNMLLEIHTNFNAFSTIGDFNLPFSLKDHNTIVKNFIANPNNNNHPCLLGLFHKSVTANIEDQLDINDWDKIIFENQYCLYKNQEMFDFLELMAR